MVFRGSFRTVCGCVVSVVLRNVLARATISLCIYSAVCEVPIELMCHIRGGGVRVEG